MITNGASRSNLLSFLTGSTTHTWQPVMTADTATLSYWLNWRFSLCALFILTTMAVAAIIIWKFEGRKKSEHEDRDNDKEAPGHLYEDEAWNTCLRSIHPVWLLSFRVFAFIMLLALLLANVAIDGSGIFYFYTQWTFTLVTIYFGFGSAISVYGCQKHWGKVGGDKGDHLSLDSEQGSYTPPILGEAANVSNQCKHFDAHRAPHCPPRAGVWTYAFQIIYQVGNVHGSHFFELHILFCGRAHLLFSNGSSMLVLTFGNVIFPGGRIRSLTYHRHMLRYGTHSISY
ncbi:Signal recognition particle SEC65 subunit [Gossypium australe]|uniref:Signal recognition particle SEC65 subunit n=1 Tax=Gossypium australe TaxID=47621 RepID=A0A5B6WM91_9ROSI|nr:Signal recognition particle SEC65 subunit [Gossypium australe]